MSHTSRVLGRVSETVKGHSFSTCPFKVNPWNAWLPLLALSEMEEKAKASPGNRNGGGVQGRKRVKSVMEGTRP